ncbi:MAG: hypothetical protein IJI66_09385 [Erysipelotrichaceae bacterium]|nr:hypothetical protein [Erysipelotrichaceae bacterium]
MTKFEETVKEMESQVEELENDLAEKAQNLDEANKERARALVDKTEEAIKSSIEKVKGIINDVQQDDKLDEFLDKVKAKSMEAVDFTKAKVTELTEKYDKENKLDKLGEDIMTEFDKIKDSDAFKKTADFLNDISGKVSEFLEKPEVKEAINKAKTTTVSLAEKGVESLKKALKTDEIPAETETTEAAPAEEAPTEETNE